MELYKTKFLDRSFHAAYEAAYPWAQYAACEAGLESGFCTSSLCIKDCNLFGMKQHRHPIYGTHVLPTREFLGGKWEVVSAEWVTYPSWRECFMDRLATLKRLASVYPHYAAALDAKDGETYVLEVSKSWSTDPERGQKVLDIFKEYTAK